MMGEGESFEKSAEGWNVDVVPCLLVRPLVFCLQVSAKVAPINLKPKVSVDVAGVSMCVDGDHFLQSEFLRTVSVRRPFPWYCFYADKSATNNDQREAPPPLLSSSVHCHLSF